MPGIVGLFLLPLFNATLIPGRPPLPPGPRSHQGRVFSVGLLRENISLLARTFLFRISLALGFLRCRASRGAAPMATSPHGSGGSLGGKKCVKSSSLSHSATIPAWRTCTQTLISHHDGLLFRVFYAYGILPSSSYCSGTQRSPLADAHAACDAGSPRYDARRAMRRLRRLLRILYTRTPRAGVRGGFFVVLDRDIVRSPRYIEHQGACDRRGRALRAYGGL